MIRALLLIAAVCLAGCAPVAVPEPATEPPVAEVRHGPPAVLKEAAKTQDAAKRYIDRRPGLSSAELIRMLDLSQAMQRAVRRVRAHRSTANVRAARVAVDALREFMK